MGKSSKRAQEAEDEGRRAQDGDGKRPGKDKKDRKSKKRRSEAAHGGDAAAAVQAEALPPPASGGSEGQPAEPQAAEAQPAAGSHDADAAAAEQQQRQQPAAKAKGGKPAPVLPWMRVPIAIEASEGVLLEEVKGLDPRLKSALEGGCRGGV